MTKVHIKLHNPNYFVVEARGQQDGLALQWKDNLHITIIQYH